MRNLRKILVCPFMIMGMLLMLMNSCKKDNNSGNPDPVSTKVTVSTVAVSNVTQTAAACGGTITGDAGATVTARGVCWSTNQTPTISDNKTTDGTGLGSFTSNITGLTANTKYYVRAYATSNEGTGYGNALPFTTLPLNGLTVNDIDGNIYHTVTIGTQVWLAENMKTTKYRDGTNIPNVITNNWIYLTTDAYCDYNNDPANSNTYGRLYNWYAATSSHKICPAGWHVPTDAEWTTLTTFLGGEGIAGGKLKETGTAHWASPNYKATNETGFTALPGGGRGCGSEFLDIGHLGFWWTSTSNGAAVAWDRSMKYIFNDVTRESTDAATGFSVRCLRD